MASIYTQQINHIFEVDIFYRSMWCVYFFFTSFIDSFIHSFLFSFTFSLRFILSDIPWGSTQVVSFPNFHVYQIFLWIINAWGFFSSSSSCLSPKKAVSSWRFFCVIFLCIPRSFPKKIAMNNARWLCFVWNWVVYLWTSFTHCLNPFESKSGWSNRGRKKNWD